MKRKLLIILFICILALCFSGCKPALSTEDFKVLDIFRESMTLVYERTEKEETDDVEYRIEVDNGTVTTGINIEFDYGVFRSGSVFDAATLMPVSAYKGNSYNLDPANNWDIYGEYGRTLEMTAVTSEGEEVRSVGLPEKYIDNEALLFTLGALDYAEGFKKNINVAVVEAGEVITYEVTYLGNETIGAPYGTFECIKVQVKYTGLVLGPKPRMYIWYSDDARRLPVQHENRGIVLLLKSVDTD